MSYIGMEWKALKTQRDPHPSRHHLTKGITVRVSLLKWTITRDSMTTWPGPIITEWPHNGIICGNNTYFQWNGRFWWGGFYPTLARNVEPQCLKRIPKKSSSLNIPFEREKSSFSHFYSRKDLKLSVTRGSSQLSQNNLLNIHYLYDILNFN